MPPKVPVCNTPGRKPYKTRHRYRSHTEEPHRFFLPPASWHTLRGADVCAECAALPESRGLLKVPVVVEQGKTCLFCQLTGGDFRLQIVFNVIDDSLGNPPIVYLVSFFRSAL